MNWVSKKIRLQEPVASSSNQRADEVTQDGAFADFNAPLAEQTTNPGVRLPVSKLSNKHAISLWMRKSR